MSLEFFNPGEGGESYDPAAFERFKEQMKKNAAAMAGARQQEQKQKDKEDRLVKILLKFIQSNQKSGILMLAAHLLKENIPASFILSIIMLGNSEVQAELKRETAGLLGPGSGSLSSAESETGKTEFSLIARFTDSSLPLKVKAELDEWGRSLFEAASAVPFKILETILDKKGELKRVVIDCTANVLDDYLAQNGAPGVSYDTCFSFCEFLMRAIAKKLKEQIEGQRMIE